MTTTRLAPITAAGLLVTRACPARCRHCYVGAGPERSEWMTLEAATAHLAALARMGVAAGGIHISGGEPFADPPTGQAGFDRLRAIVRAARIVGLAGIGYVETNGFWADSADLVRNRLVALAADGMQQLSISADPYHQEFVPPDRIRLLYETAREVLGPRGVRARRWKWLQAPQDVSAMPEPARLDLFRSFLRRYPERMTGRAAERLSPLADCLPLNALPRDGCRRPLLESAHVHIDPEGWVYPGTCAGIVFGRAGPDRPLDRLLEDWRPDASPLLASLAEGGPMRLLEEAGRRGFRPDPQGYAGKCHLCWVLRAALVRAGAEAESLEPATLYLTV